VPQPIKLVDLDGFIRAFAASGGEGMIWFGDDLAWHARTTDRSATCILTRADDNTSFPRLEGLLSMLAGVGIRRIDVEWDGFPASMYDSKTGLTNFVV
jgi:hypothetical protein